VVSRKETTEMDNVIIDMSMSLDGYIAAPNDNPEQGLGENGDARESAGVCKRRFGVKEID
jgi:hypothetical protein